jgi:hypothetical protein
MVPAPMQIIENPVMLFFKIPLEPLDGDEYRSVNTYEDKHWSIKIEDVGTAETGKFVDRAVQPKPKPKKKTSPKKTSPKKKTSPRETMPKKPTPKKTSPKTKSAESLAPF